MGKKNIHQLSHLEKYLLKTVLIAQFEAIDLIPGVPQYIDFFRISLVILIFNCMIFSCFFGMYR
jgi:hypothetical protein